MTQDINFITKTKSLIDNLKSVVPITGWEMTEMNLRLLRKYFYINFLMINSALR